ncbi:MAG: thiamine-phosphate kinase [Pseudomonadota bacterium]
MSEFSIIDRIRQLCSASGDDVLVGPGDDTAVLSTDRLKGGHLLMTVDTMVEKAHFVRDSLTPRQIGRKCIAAAVSDIAAMGGKPLWALVSCGFDGSQWPEDKIVELARGMKERLDDLGAGLVGGNLARSDVFFVSVTVAGLCSGRPMKRSGAVEGDLIAVTGSLGGARIGRRLLEKERKADHPTVKRYIDPPARIQEGLGLGKIAHACIDISDGLLIDLGHLLRASGAGAVLEADRIPLPDCSGLDPELDEDVFLAALSGGEDYELLAAIPPDGAPKLKTISSDTGTPISVIGKITSNPDEIIMIDAEGNEIPLPHDVGWDHFK